MPTVAVCDLCVFIDEDTVTMTVAACFAIVASSEVSVDWCHDLFVIFGAITSGLRQRHFSRYPVIPTPAAPDSDELHCPSLCSFTSYIG